MMIVLLCDFGCMNMIDAIGKRATKKASLFSIHTDHVHTPETPEIINTHLPKTEHGQIESISKGWPATAKATATDRANHGTSQRSDRG